MRRRRSILPRLRAAGSEVVRSGQPLRQPLPQDAQRLPHLCLDGLHGNPHCAGDLGVAQAVHATQLEDLAAAFGKTAHRILERGVDFLLHELPFRGRGGRPFGYEIRFGASCHLFMTDRVQCAVAGGAEQIRLE